MFIGALTGFYGITFFGDEVGIALSVFVLGIAIFKKETLPLLLTFSLVGFFAFFHGHAHGIEIPRLANISAYTSGFMLATVLLHLVGIILTIMSFRLKNGALYMRYLGLAIALIGLSIFIQNVMLR
jgi:urease accessory protein